MTDAQIRAKIAEWRERATAHESRWETCKETRGRDLALARLLIYTRVAAELEALLNEPERNDDGNPKRNA